MRVHTCGAEIADSAMWCVGCSSAVLDAATTAVPVVPPPSPAPAPVPVPVPVPDEPVTTAGAVVCPVCERPASHSARVCDFCGVELAAVADPARAPGACCILPGGASISLGPLPLLLGREVPDASITASLGPHDAVSRRHAQLTLTGSRVVVEDLGSTNGTYVDGRKLAPHAPETAAVPIEVRLGAAIVLRLVAEPARGSRP